MKFTLNGRIIAALLIFTFSFIAIPILMPAAMAEGSKEAAASTAPDFDLRNLNGTYVTLSQFKGIKPVLIVFWATWCPYCRAEQPKLARLRQSIPRSKLAILAVDVGSVDPLTRVKDYIKANPVPYTVLYDAGSKVTRAYGVEGIPNIVLVDKNRVIKYQGSELPADPLSLVR